MEITFLVNDRAEIGRKQTTLRLIDVALRRGHRVLVSDVSGLSAAGARSTTLHAVTLDGDGHVSDADLLQRLVAAPVVRRPLDATDLVFVRTNPGRDPARSARHAASLSMLAGAADRGLRVLNAPRGLALAASKLYVLQLPPETRPRTLVSADRDELIQFVEGLGGPAVFKPLCGSRGLDVFCVQSEDDPNLRQILDVVLRQGYAVAQNFLPEAVDGDTRVLVWRGQILEADGRPAAFRRVPGRGDFRSNVDAGGRTARADVTPAIRAADDKIGPVLLRDGLEFVGLDFVGSSVVEVNAYSPGGLRAARKFEGAAFTDALFERIES